MISLGVPRSNAPSPNSIPAPSDSLCVSIGDPLKAAAEKATAAASSPFGQKVVGFGLGLGLHKIYGPLTETMIKALGVSGSFPDPFRGLGLPLNILLTPFVCVVGPIFEEEIFRRDLQGPLKRKFELFYLNRGFSDSAANITARATAVFFGSILFGLFHFTNAIVFWCNPVLFLPQVVAATIMGLIFGLAKEFSGAIHLPIGMHIGNNTLAWAQYMKGSF